MRDMFESVFGGGMFSAIKDILLANPSDPEGGYYAAWKIVQDIYDSVVVPVGLGIMIIWFLVGFMQKATSEQMNFDQIFLLCVKLVVSFYLIKNGFNLFCDIWGLGNALLRDLTGTPGTGAATEQIKIDAWNALTGQEITKWADAEDPGWLDSLLCMAKLLFPWIVAAILKGCATFIAYSRMLEMLLRMTLAPIALSDFMLEGLHSGGWRYLKTFLAICLQGFVIMLIAQLFTALTIPSSGKDFMDIVVGYLVISVSAIALMFKSLSVCKEIVGAH